MMDIDVLVTQGARALATIILYVETEYVVWIWEYEYVETD